MGRHKTEKVEKKQTEYDRIVENYVLSVRKRRQILSIIAGLPENPSEWDHHNLDTWKDLHASAIKGESVGEMKGGHND